MRGRDRPSLRAATTLGIWLASLALQSTAETVDFDFDHLEGVDDPNSYYTELHICPVACDSLSPSNWTVYNSYPRLEFCDEPLLFDFALYNSVVDSTTPTKIRVCTAGNANSTINAFFNGTRAIETEKRQDTGAICSSAETASESQVTFEVSHNGESRKGSDDALTTTLKKLQEHFDQSDPCPEPFMFSYYQGLVAGIYVGPSFGKASAVSLIDSFLEQAKSGAESAATSTAQLCGSGRNSHHVMGLVVDTTGNVTAVQNAVRDWNDAKCVNDFDSKAELQGVAVFEEKDVSFESSGNGTFSNGTVASLHARADCRTIEVYSGDGCAALASRCGISGSDFTKYNPDKSLCSTLAVGQRVCCTSGSLPDIRPKPEADGTCFKHRVLGGETCSSIAASNGLKVKDLEEFNNKTTWGWYGCNKLMADMYMCLSTGKPPMPFPIPNAICGPTKPDSPKPTDDQTLADVSPCPLNACCNVWGQCGISGDFCEEKESESGNPGTSGLQNGCVSNCGMEIKKGTTPGEFGRIGYYETWNFNRECLHQHVDNANSDGSYTIIHWAFAEVNTNDWTVKIVDDYDQWGKFKQISAKKVISFGGWGYSTLPATYDILRQGMSPANRNTFAANIAKFLSDEGLDGVDFDWEYPGADDIKGTPGGTKDDGPNYLKFLSVMKSKLSKGMTMSIAAPASYWYLRNFPIKQMASLLNYIVYMTYDLHGQWDAGSKFSVEGCPSGNCLRSHVNLTETNTVLAMITKAGVDTAKIYVGESSYGRSFKMAQAGCKGPDCMFLGDELNSPAKKGRCTDTSGYISNAEIEEIISGSNVDLSIDGPGTDDTQVETWFDKDSDSDMMVYEGTEWVAYMNEGTKNRRRDHWKDIGFAGTIDWAVDLRAFTMDDFRDVNSSDSTWSLDIQDSLPPPLEPCKGSYATLEDIQKATGIPHHCVSVYMVEVMSNDLAKSMQIYDDLMASGYDGRFNKYADAIVQSGKKALREWMYDNGNDYFTCDVTEPLFCCDWCDWYFSGVNDGQCKYCDNKYCGDWSYICTQPDVQCDTLKPGWQNITGPCPPDYSKRAGPKPTDGYGQSIYWHMKRDKEDEFWAKIYEGTGIAQKDIRLEDQENYKVCTPAYPDECKYYGWDYGIPVPHGYDRSDIINPKDIVDKAYDNIKNIVKDLPVAVQQLKDGVYEGSGSDLAEALSMPVYMIGDAVTKIKDINDKIEDMDRAKRKNIILAFLSAILFFVPVVGQIASSIASLAAIGRFIAILGTLGEVAMDIYSVVDTKGNEPLAIFGLVLAPLAVFDVVQIAKAASLARTMKKDDLLKLGKGVSDRVDLVKDMNSVCKLAKRDVFPVGALPMSSLNAEPVYAQAF